MITFDFRMGIPISAPATTVKNLHETNASLNQASGYQTLLAEGFALGLIETIEGLRLGAFALQLHGLGYRTLHLKGQLVRFDARAQVLVIGIVNSREVIELA